MSDEEILKQYPAMRESKSLKETLVHFVERKVLLSQICDAFGAAGLLAKSDADSDKFYGYRNEILKYLATVSKNKPKKRKRSGDEFVGKVD